jgi:ATP-dependent Clp protease ATP-binding subunit ClpA
MNAVAKSRVSMVGPSTFSAYRSTMNTNPAHSRRTHTICVFDKGCFTCYSSFCQQ